MPPVGRRLLDTPQPRCARRLLTNLKAPADRLGEWLEDYRDPVRLI
jgi:hypothetical protein